MPRPIPSVSPHFVLPILLAGSTLAACAGPAVPAATETSGAPPSPTSAPTLTSPPLATTTDTPSPTAVPSPTAPPADRTISPATLAQLRPLWVLDEPGNENYMSGCQDTACWMKTRIGSYAFSPDGETLAVGVCTVDSTENTTNPRKYRYHCPGPAEIRLYDAATGELMQTLAVGDFPISLAFHPDGTFLAAGMAQRSIEIWELSAEEKVQTLLHSTTHDGVTGLAFSPGGDLLVSEGENLLQLWRWERGLPAGMIEGASDFGFSPDGERLATLTWARGGYVEARFYPLDDLGSFRAFRLDWSKSPNRIVFTPHGDALVAMGSTELELLNPETGNILAEAKGDDLLAQGDWAGYTRITPAITGDGRFVLRLSVKAADDSYLDGLALWDPRTQGAHAWLMSLDEEVFDQGDVFFPGFNEARWTLAPGDRYLLGEDFYSGILWVWGVDPTVPSEGVICLGTCSS